MHFALDLPKNWNASLSSKGQKFLPLLLLFCANVRISAPEILIAMDAGWTILISSSNSCAGKLLARISRDYQCSARQLFGPSVYPYRLMWSGLIQFPPRKQVCPSMLYYLCFCSMQCPTFLSFIHIPLVFDIHFCKWPSTLLHTSLARLIQPQITS